MSYATQLIDRHISNRPQKVVQGDTYAQTFFYGEYGDHSIRILMIFFPYHRFTLKYCFNREHIIIIRAVGCPNTLCTLLIPISQIYGAIVRCVVSYSSNSSGRVLRANTGEPRNECMRVYIYARVILKIMMKMVTK